ncbi:MAG: hypothetical protein AAF628_21565 [Planctomycetota bacterium]
MATLAQAAPGLRRALLRTAPLCLLLGSPAPPARAQTEALSRDQLLEDLQALRDVVRPPTSSQVPGADTLIAFSSERDGQGDVFVMRGDGSYPRRVTPCSDLDHPTGWLKAVGPAWSPDGARLAYQVYRADRPRALVVMRADGADRQVIVDDRDAANAAWSPDGANIAYSSGGDLWLVPAAGGPSRRLTQLPLRERGSAWSPDGRRLAFSAYRYLRGKTREEIYVLDVDGGEPRQITDLGGETSLPSWSPDGHWLAFNTGDDDSADLCIARPDGSDLRYVTRSGKFYGPRWSPDGKTLYATGFVDEEVDVYAIAIDGRSIRRLSDAPGADHYVDVRPRTEAPIRTPDPDRVCIPYEPAELEARNAIAELRAAEALMRAKRWRGAVAEYRKALARDPKLGRAWYRMGLCLQRDGQPTESLAAYAQASAFAQWAARALYQSASIHVASNRPDAAFAALDAAIDAGFRDGARLRDDPNLAPLRRDPRFAEIEQRANG